MDLLTHLFLPLTVAYVLWPDRFASPAALSLGVLGVLADADKYLGVQGLGHSALALGPLCAAMLAAEYALRGRVWLSPVAVGLVASHLVLDFVGGSQVPLLYPLVEQGVALQYPARTVFGEGVLGVTVEGPVVDLKTAPPVQGEASYGFLRGAGVSSALAFLTIFGVRTWRRRSPRGAGVDPPAEGSTDASEE